MPVETVKVKADNSRGFKIINRSDFQEDTDTLYESENADTTKQAELTPAEREAEEKFTAERKARANFGQVDGAGGIDTRKNPSGTYSEPTPSDIRYPNKDNTEFENNHGAFVNRSASELREELGLEDKPGGLNPAEKEFHDAEEAAARLEAKRRADGEIGNEFELDIDNRTREVDPSKVPQRPADNFNSMTINELKAYAEEHDIDLAGHTKRSDIIEAIREAETANQPAET